MHLSAVAQDKTLQTSFFSCISVHIPQSLEVTDAKISLRKVPLKDPFCWNSSYKLLVATDQMDFMAQSTQLFSDNLQIFLLQSTPFPVCLVYAASYVLSFKYTSKYRTMTICEYNFHDYSIRQITHMYVKFHRNTIHVKMGTTFI